MNEKEKSVIEAFKDRAKQFWTLWESLNRKADVADQATPELKAEYASVMNRGTTIRKTVERLTATIDTGGRYLSKGKNWLSDKFGLGGMSTHIMDTTPGLSAIPLIPIAVIGLSLSAIGKWTMDAVELNKKLDVYKSLIAKGVNPSRASGIADRLVGKKPLFGGVPTIAPIILAAIVGFIYFNKGR